MIRQKVCFIVGTRPNFVKAAPLINEFINIKKYKIYIIHTGQHYDDNMSNVFFKELNIRKPDYNLNIGSGRHGYQTGKIMIEIEGYFIIIVKEILITGTYLIIYTDQSNSNNTCLAANIVL